MRIQPIAAVLACLAGIVAGAAPAAAQPVSLRWQLDQGDQLRWKFVQHTETETGVLGSGKPNIKVIVDMTVQATWQVESAGDDSFTIVQTIDSIRLQMNAPPGDPVLYDSASQDGPTTKGAKELADKMKPLLGVPVTLEMNARGEVAAVKPQQQGDEASQAQQQSLLQILSGSLLTLPAAPVRGGDKWKDESTADAALGKLTIKRAYTLKKPSGGEQQIELAGVLTLQPDEREDGAVIRLRSQGLSGTYRFDSEAGLLKGSEITQTTVTDSTYRDSRVAVRAKTTLVTEVTK